ncbi:MAG: phosphatase PAP2 family protein [Patescibacteria group bacterium]|nr:phosphatase PAP2 family protein [Patescibacteria group bacterium]
MVNETSSRARIISAVFLLLLAFLIMEVLAAPDFMTTGDQWFDTLLLSVRSPFFLGFFGGITYLGNAVVVVGMTGISLLYLFFSKRHRIYAYGLATTVAGAGASAYVLKEIVARARPGGLIPSVVETSFSFPSGHATASMAFYGFAAYILCMLFPERKALTIAIATILIAVVGFSRLYLGVHFPSDVLAGYLIGGIWLIIGSAVVRHYAQKI